MAVSKQFHERFSWVNGMWVGWPVFAIICSNGILCTNMI
jgi:hypothetical protein